MVADRGSMVIPPEHALFHRPAVGNGRLRLEWQGSGGIYKATMQPDGTTEEQFNLPSSTQWIAGQGLYQQFGVPPGQPNTLVALRRASVGEGPSFWPALASLAQSHDVKLSLDALRVDSVVADAPLEIDGANMAAMVNRWRSGQPERSDEFEAVLRTYLPEIRRVLAPAVRNGRETHFRLEFEQTDGEKFDAQHVSDGVLFFAGLVAHVIDAGPGALILLEEPENSIHPRRLHDVVELFKRLAAERQCQFIVATHSPVLLDEFRDEPEAVLLFRRSEQGTIVRQLSEVPELVDALGKTRPGEMLASGFFNDRF
ncbi:MAG: AAA family ATPase [Polyangiaceae bacterium]